MVASERVFQYVQLGGGGLAADSRPAGLPQLPRLSEQSSSRAARKAEQPGSPGQDSLLPPLLPAPALAGSKGSSGWLQAGHLRFEGVWLRYEPWQGTASSGGLASTACGAVGSSAAAAAAANGGGGDGSGRNGSNSSGGSSSSSPWVLRGVSLDIQPGKLPSAALRVLGHPPVSQSSMHASEPCGHADRRTAGSDLPFSQLPLQNCITPTLHCYCFTCRQPRGHLRPHRRRQVQPAGRPAAPHPHCLRAHHHRRHRRCCVATQDAAPRDW